jgi:tetratricopeptide (TPR) repeat protein
MRILVMPKLAGLVIVVALVYALTIEWPLRIRLSPGGVLGLLWLLWALLFSARLPLLAESLAGNYLRLCGWFTWCLTALWFFRARSLFRHTYSALVPDVLMVVGLVLALCATGQSLGLSPIGLRSPYGARSFALLENPNTLATFLSAIIPLTIPRAYCGVRSSRIRYGAVLIVLVLGVLSTGSLSGYLALLAGISASLAAVRWPRRRWLPFAVTILFLVGAYASPVWAARIKPTAQSRWIIWNTASQTILQEPLTGSGLDNLAPDFDRYLPPHLVYLQGDVRVDSAHNELLDMALAVGLIGVAGYIWLLALVYRRAFRDLVDKQSAESHVAEALVSCLVIHVGLAVNFWTISLLWLGATLLAWLDSLSASHSVLSPVTKVRARLPLAVLAVAVLVFALWRPVKADYLLTTLTGDPFHDIDTLHQIAQLSPSRAYHHLILARAVALTEGPGPAMGHYLDACSADPDDYLYHAEAGTNAAMLQQRELSERLLAVALRLTGAQNARVWKAWGDAALYQHDPTRAIARYQRAIELNETSAEAYLAMAQAFSLQNNSVAAESALDAARRLQGAPSESRE